MDGSSPTTDSLCTSNMSNVPSKFLLSNVRRISNSDSSPAKIMPITMNLTEARQSGCENLFETWVISSFFSLFITFNFEFYEIVYALSADQLFVHTLRSAENDTLEQQKEAEEEEKMLASNNSRRAYQNNTNKIEVKRSTKQNKEIIVYSRLEIQLLYIHVHYNVPSI